MIRIGGQTCRTPTDERDLDITGRAAYGVDHRGGMRSCCMLQVWGWVVD